MSYLDNEILVNELIKKDGEGIVQRWGDAKYPFCFLGKIKNRFTKLGETKITGCVSQIAFGIACVAENADVITRLIKHDCENLFDFSDHQAEEGWDDMNEEERRHIIERFIYWQNQYEETVNEKAV